ncbi:MAG: ATP-binding protein [Candidatus Hydrogenedentes bacterium]|nr:ATP-binding protein [Candidatus Hydrogenedentota bacterium]
MIARHADTEAIRALLEHFPVTALLGPRQAGKTCLARAFPAAHFFDLENPRDAVMMEQAQLALEPLSGLIVIDEIQRAPNLFPLLRHLVDTRPGQRYLILGSASRDLIRQSAESLAGRIAYHELGGFRLEDVGTEHWRSLWLRGGLPRAYTADSDAASHLWREQYVATFLERDIPQLGIDIPAAALRRFWTMLCHYHGQLMNYSEFARSFGVSDATVRRYLDVLEGTFMIRLLQPWHANVGKRLVKRPKIYFRDSGLFHTLLSARTAGDLATHNKLGASWEGFALETVTRALGKRKEELYFWATHSGAEVDLFWQDRGKNWAVEVKYADAPRITRSMRSALEDLELEHLWVVYPGDKAYPLGDKVSTVPVGGELTGLNYSMDSSVRPNRKNDTLGTTT